RAVGADVADEFSRLELDRDVVDGDFLDVRAREERFDRPRQTRRAAQRPKDFPQVPSPDHRHASRIRDPAGSPFGSDEGDAMSTRRCSFLVLFLALSAVPSVSLAARAPRTPPTPAPLHWEMVVDRATYDVVDLDPPLLPAAPGRVAVHYAWQENDKIEQWWQQVVSGNREPKDVILFVKRGTSKAKKTLISYALDGVG